MDHRGKILFTVLLSIFLTGTATAQTYEFDTCGSSGRYGPSQSQCDSVYTGTNLEGEVNVVGEGIQEWAVPEDGTYRISAAGAQGGGDSGSPGGKGAFIEGEFTLENDEVISILVGQEGGQGGSDSASGGGGTFVVQTHDYSTATESDILVIAGGGGGGYNERPGRDGVETECSSSGPNAGNACDGNGGPAYSSGGGGGGGFMGNGADSDWGYGGSSFVNGGLGGGGGAGGGTGNGGFGGGGSQTNSGSNVAGGGGGYSGGGGNDEINQDDNAGGGGSYNSGNNQNNQSGDNSGKGYVKVELVESGTLDFCNFRGPFNECIMNQTNQLQNQQYNVSSVFEARENAVFEAFSGRATLNITNSTGLSGLWRGEFVIQTEDPRIEPGADFRPENGDIVVGE